VMLHLNFKDPSYRNLCRGAKGSQIKYGTAAWKRGFANALSALRDHLFQRGLPYERVLLYVWDEPRGDPDDPSSTAHSAIEGARHVKEADPKLRTFTNPSSDTKNGQWVERYFPFFDVLGPYRPHLESNRSAIAKYQASGREIWTYAIIANYNAPGVYRTMFWQSARDGFTGVCAFWNYDDHAGDPFNPHDSKPDNPQRITDYCVVYLDVIRKRLTGAPGIPSRRWEASYQGNQDYRAIAVCRDLIVQLESAAQKADAERFQSQLDATIASAIGASGEQMDAARASLLRSAVEMRRLLGK